MSQRDIASDNGRWDRSTRVVNSMNQILIFIVLAIIFVLASMLVFTFYVSQENFASLLSPNIDENGFLSIQKFLAHYAINVSIVLTAFSTALVLILIAFSRTRLGSLATSIIVGLSSVSVSALVSWIGSTSEFSNGQLFRFTTESRVDPIRMLIFVASCSVAFSVVILLLILVLKSLFDFSKKLIKADNTRDIGLKADQGKSTDI